MIDELLTKLIECRTIVLKGFNSTHESDLIWLNDMCAKFLSLFNCLHKYLVFDANTKSVILESCFLCTTQVTTCIKNLESVLKTAIDDCIVLTSTRQFFLDRIMFCITRLQDIITTNNCPPLNDHNFTTCIDNALDMVTDFNDLSNCTNQCQMLADMMIKSKNIKQVVEQLLSQALAFMQVTLADDKIAINALCQKVLKEALGLERACSFSDAGKSQELNDRQIKVQLLETALIQLENVVNESVLKLLYQVFRDLAEKPIGKIRDMHRETPDDSIIDEMTADFDSITDRLVQVGVFALAFADNRKIAAVVRSCLASLEALEPELIPSILSYNCEAHSKILEQHWTEEIEQLETQITKIIDTGAFCKSLLDIIEQRLRTNAEHFDRNDIVEIVAKANILLHHLKMNEDLLNLHVDGVVKLYFQDFNFILKECDAAVDYIDKIDEQRIIKRIKILKSTLKKLEEALSKDSVNHYQIDKDPMNDINLSTETGEILSNGIKHTSDNFFTGHNIKASTHSILYKTSTDLCTEIGPVQKKGFDNGPKKIVTPGRLRTSLRVAMFKRSNDLSINIVSEENMRNESMGLNITDILEQLTDLSNTLSEKCAIDSTIVQEDCKIIIKLKHP